MHISSYLREAHLCPASGRLKGGVDATKVESDTVGCIAGGGVGRVVRLGLRARGRAPVHRAAQGPAGRPPRLLAARRPAAG